MHSVCPLFYFPRSAPIEFNGNTSSSTTVDVFVSNLQSGGVRTFQVFCAAECAADGNVTIVSDPTVVTLFTCECSLGTIPQGTGDLLLLHSLHVKLPVVRY